MHRFLELLRRFWIRIYPETCVGILFSFSTFAFIMTTSDKLSAMRGRLSASRARAGSSLAGKSLFNRGVMETLSRLNLLCQVLSLPIFVMQINYVWAKWERLKCVYRS